MLPCSITATAAVTISHWLMCLESKREKKNEDFRFFNFTVVPSETVLLRINTSIFLFVVWTHFVAMYKMVFAQFRIKIFNYCPKLIIQQCYKRIKRSGKNHHIWCSVVMLGSVCVKATGESERVRVVNACQNSFRLIYLPVRLCFIYMTYFLLHRHAISPVFFSARVGVNWKKRIFEAEKKITSECICCNLQEHKIYCKGKIVKKQQIYKISRGFPIRTGAHTHVIS